MKLSMQNIYDRGSSEVNEDELLVKENLFAVFDGVTSLSGFINKNGKTGGKIAAEIAQNTFAENDRPLQELALMANRDIQDAMKAENINISDKGELWATTVAAVRLRDNAAEFFAVADSPILAIFEDYSYKLVTEIGNHDLETLRQWKALAEEKKKNIRKLLQPQIKKVRLDANVKYGLLNGEDTAQQFFKQGKISTTSVRSLILFTDGLFIPKSNPEANEDWGTFVKLYRESGLGGVLAHVRTLEKRDPECWEFPRIKQFDDVAAIGLDFS
jgi:serine/threonine protein phosphatase PrpC